MERAVRTELLQLDSREQAVRERLTADGSILWGYHPHLERVHEESAERLKVIIAAHGWPTVPLVGVAGSLAAFRIAQNARSQPHFMIECRAYIDDASRRGLIPRVHYARIDDRIRVYQGRPQRFGTMWLEGPDGMRPYPIDNPSEVHGLRAEVGLPSLATLRATRPPSPAWDPATAAARADDDVKWRRRVGWIP